MRFQGSFDLPRGKTLCIVFIAQIEWVAKIGFLIGNDLETSEVLYFVRFYINQKNTIYVSTKILIFLLLWKSTLTNYM